MRRVLAGIITAVLLFATVAFLGGKLPLTKPTATVHADEGAACSLARSAGNYGFTDSGTVLGIGPRTAIGVFSLDESGNLQNGVATSSLNGSIAQETFSGTYTVNADCTGTLSGKIYAGGAELFAVTLNIAFDDDMKQIRGIFTSVTTPSGAALATIVGFDARKQ